MCIVVGGVDFCFFVIVFFVYIGVKSMGYCCVEVGEVSIVVMLWNVVGKVVDVFLEVVVLLQGYFYVDIVFFGGEIENIWVDWCFVFVEIFNECFDVVFVVEMVFFVVVFIVQVDRDVGVQE